MSMPSLGTEGSKLSQKIYFVRKKKIPQEKVNKHNFFKMTSVQDLSHSSTSNPEESGYSITIPTSPSKPHNEHQSFSLPIITESKYKFHPSQGCSWVKKSTLHHDDPLYRRHQQTFQGRNIKRLRALKNIWKKYSEDRSDHKSLVDRSSEKANKYLQNHNNHVEKEEKTAYFTEMLRNRHSQNFKCLKKGIRAESLKGIKGQGGKVKSLFQQLYCIEEVYKVGK